MKNLNLDEYRDKVRGCWLGKNIGGTLGAPFEGKRETNEVTFYTQELNGEPVPNDDLDLQLIWLAAVELKGLYQLTPRMMGDFWLGNIPCPSGEYAICRANIANGFYPPLSGSCHNDELKGSNGAWIRSEIWACIFPGSPDEAIKFAYLDAIADHAGEGVYAEMFTAALEAAAFVESDLRALLEIGLSKIPPNCRVARGIRTAMRCHDAGADWREARETIVREVVAECGWFQAPGNLGFLAIALLYGGGDFGKSVCLAVNCGDDTDCTAATVGALLGIIHGAGGLPEEWIKPIGEKIVTVAVNSHNMAPVPKTIDELTARTVRRAQIAALENRSLPELTDRPTAFSAADRETLRSDRVAAGLWAKSPYELAFPLGFAEVAVEYVGGPDFQVGESRELILKARLYDAFVNQLYFQWRTPAGWEVTPACGSLLIRDWFENTIVCRLTAGAFQHCCEYLTLELRAGDRQTPVLLQIPVALAGSVVYPNIRVDYPLFQETRRRIGYERSEGGVS